MLQNQPMGTSKFDPNLENDFSADEITLLFETGRLAQFQEELVPAEGEMLKDGRFVDRANKYFLSRFV